MLNRVIDMFKIHGQKTHICQIEYWYVSEKYLVVLISNTYKYGLFVSHYMCHIAFWDWWNRRMEEILWWEKGSNNLKEWNEKSYKVKISLMVMLNCGPSKKPNSALGNATRVDRHHIFHFTMLKLHNAEKLRVYLLGR